jgi:hypothetical protein
MMNNVGSIGGVLLIVADVDALIIPSSGDGNIAANLLILMMLVLLLIEDNTFHFLVASFVCAVLSL